MVIMGQQPLSEEGGERPGKVHPKEALFGGRSILQAGLPVPLRITLAKAQGPVKLPFFCPSAKLAFWGLRNSPHLQFA